MQAVGGFEAALDLFESCIVPSLLANCGTWTQIEKKTVEKLDALQDMYGRVILKVPQSTPKLSIRAWDGLEDQTGEDPAHAKRVETSPNKKTN